MKIRLLIVAMLSYRFCDEVLADCNDTALLGRLGFLEYNSAMKGETCTWKFQPPTDEGNYVLIMKLFQVKNIDRLLAAFLPHGNTLKETSTCFAYASSAGDHAACRNASNAFDCPEIVLMNGTWPPHLSFTSGEANDQSKVFRFKLVYVFLECRTHDSNLTKGNNNENEDVTNTNQGQSGNKIPTILAVLLGVSLLISLLVIAYLIKRKATERPKSSIDHMHHNQLLPTTSLQSESLAPSNGTNIYSYADQIPATPAGDNGVTNQYSSIPTRQMVTNILYHTHGEVLNNGQHV